MTAPPREPVFCPQRKKPCIAGCPYPSECPEPAPSAERAHAARDARDADAASAAEQRDRFAAMVNAKFAAIGENDA